MRNFRDALVLGLTIALQTYLVYLSGRYFGWNETTLNAWALACVLGLLLTNRYYAWWRR